MKQFSLCGQWEMRCVDSTQWISCTVPGSVVSTLLDKGKMIDPYWRDNETKIQSIFEKDYVFRRVFSVEEAFLQAKHVELCCDGLDTIAEVTLNGQVVGRADNMHRYWRFDCGNALKAGSNTLEIRFTSSVNYLKDYPSSIGKRFSTIRKAACMYGWDWGPELPDCGIWRDIRLEAYDWGRITGTVIRQKHESGRVTLFVTPFCENAPEGSTLSITLTDPQGVTIATAFVNSGAEAQLLVEAPQFWWPVGYGQQPLYRVKIQLISCGTVWAQEEKTLGLRTISLDRSVQPDGSHYRFLVNDVPIFFRGENLIIPDSILSRTTVEYWEKLIENCLKSNLNGIRVWGGAYYPPDEFYDLCDANGILVYQDMMFASSFYQVWPEFLENVRAELEDNLSRIASHACLALICGNNEIDAIYTVGGSQEPETAALRILFGAGTDPLPESTRQYLWGHYKTLFLELIPELCRKWAPDVSYVHSSPSIRKPGKAESFFDYLSDGDMHYYLQYNGNAPYQRIRQMRSRFMTEIGFQSYPDIKTIYSFTESEDRLPYTPVMYTHQKCASGNEAIELYMSRDYAVPQDFSDYVCLSQLQAGEIMRYTVEHFRRDNAYCRGIILWQLNDCWPVVSWSGIDYYGRWKALQYYIRRFYAPVLVSAEDTDTHVGLWISNETLQPCKGVLSWSLTDQNKGILDQGSSEITAQPGESRCFVSLDYSDKLDDSNRSRTYLTYRFVGTDMEAEGTVLFTLAKDFDFIKPAVTWSIHPLPKGAAIDIYSNVFTKSVALLTTQGDCIFSDNYFDLQPEQPKTITIEWSDCNGISNIDDLKAALTVNTLNDILLRAKEQ